MKPTILTQKNVCAFLGLIMALTIVWSANVEAKSDSTLNANAVPAYHMNEEMIEDLPQFELDLQDVKGLPTITMINKYGEVVAEFYGEKTELQNKFEAILEKGTLFLTSGKQDIYLVK